jgi:RHS repeat-associated protein
MITNQYTYNGDGQRVQIVDSEGTKKPIWDMEKILLETDGSNATTVVYTLEPAGYGNLVSQRRSSTTSFYLFDALGSTRKLTSSGGSVTDSYDFKAYGETFASSGSTVNVFRWVGELGYYFDIDRLAYYLRARPYSPKLARFLSIDPTGFDGSPRNLYEYVLGNPTNWVDPLGMAARPILPTPDLEDIDCFSEYRSCIFGCQASFLACVAKGLGQCELACLVACLPAWYWGHWGYGICFAACTGACALKLINDVHLCSLEKDACKSKCERDYKECCDRK